MMNMRIGGLLNTEIKFIEVNRRETALTAQTDWTGMALQPSSGCTRWLNAPVYGDGPSQRDGHKIKCIYIFIQGYIDFPEATRDQERVMKKDYISMRQDSKTNGETINTVDRNQNDMSIVKGSLCWQRT